MKKILYINVLAILTFIQVFGQTEDKLVLELNYKNPKPIISNYTNDEQAYIDAAIFFNSKYNTLKSNDASAKSAFDEIKQKFLDVINSYPNSNLIDDCQLAIAEAAKVFDDKDLYEQELQKVINQYPNQHMTYLNFEHPVCNAILPSMQSSFLQTDAYAQFQLGMIYFSPAVISDKLDYETAIPLFENVIINYPYSYFSAAAQYNKAVCLSLTSTDRKLVIDEYEKVFDSYRKYSLELAEAALVRLGDYAIKYLPSEIEKIKTKLKSLYSSEDYLAESRFHNNKNSKWNKKNLKVYFKRTNGIISNTDSLIIESVINKFNSYNFTNLSLEFIDVEFNADIEIVFTSTASNFTQLTTKNSNYTIDEIEHAEIKLKDNSSEEKLKEIIIHELGHAVGLYHSYNNNDNLYFSGNNRFEYSERDINTINKLYATENSPPEFLTNPYTPRISPGEKIFYDIDAQDLDFESPIYSIDNKPSWLEIDEETGVITGSPQESERGYHEFRIRITDYDNNSVTTLWRMMISDDPALTSINEFTEEEEIPENFVVSNPYPNPFNSITNFRICSQNSGSIKINFYSVPGEKIYNLSTKINPGETTLKINSNNLSSGIYIYSVYLDNSFKKSGKIVYVK